MITRCGTVVSIDGKQSRVKFAQEQCTVCPGNCIRIGRRDSILILDRKLQLGQRVFVSVSGLNLSLLLGMLLGLPLALLLLSLAGGGSAIVVGLGFLLGCGLSWLVVRSRLAAMLLQPQISFAGQGADQSALQK